MFYFVNMSKAQEDKYPETVCIKIYETFVGAAANMLEAKIVTVDQDNVVTNIPLKASFRLIDDNKEFELNQVKIRLELQKWHNKGFLVKSTTSACPFDGLMVTMLVLQKN